MQTLSQDFLDYLNGLCCPTPVVTEYPIKVQGVFSDQASGDAYINSKLISGTLVNSSFQNGLYTFETSAGAEVAVTYMSNLLTNGTFYEDLTGLITTYGVNAFAFSDGSTIKLGSGLTFDGTAFTSSQNSTIEVGNFVALNNNSFGLASSNNTFNLKGTIGATTGDDKIFEISLTFNGNIINTILSNQTADGGNKEGDLLWIENNGGTVNYVL